MLHCVQLSKGGVILNNQYDIIGDFVLIYLSNYDKPCIIDLDDLEKFEKIKQKLNWHKSTGYICYCHYVRDEHGKLRQTQERVHDIVMRESTIPSGYYIDHINHKSYDNRKANLRIVSPTHNSTNRRSKNSNNKSGHRNVFWNKQASKWQVRLCKNYKSICIGLYDDLAEAAIAAQRAREQYYGEYAGNT